MQASRQVQASEGASECPSSAPPPKRRRPGHAQGGSADPADTLQHDVLAEHACAGPHDPNLIGTDAANRTEALHAGQHGASAALAVPVAAACLAPPAPTLAAEYLIPASGDTAPSLAEVQQHAGITRGSIPVAAGREPGCSDNEPERGPTATLDAATQEHTEAAYSGEAQEAAPPHHWQDAEPQQSPPPSDIGRSASQQGSWTRMHHDGGDGASLVSSSVMRCCRFFGVHSSARWHALVTLHPSVGSLHGNMESRLLLGCAGCSCAPVWFVSRLQTGQIEHAGDIHVHVHFDAPSASSPAVPQLDAAAPFPAARVSQAAAWSCSDAEPTDHGAVPPWAPLPLQPMTRLVAFDDCLADLVAAVEALPSPSTSTEAQAQAGPGCVKAVHDAQAPIRGHLQAQPVSTHWHSSCVTADSVPQRAVADSYAHSRGHHAADQADRLVAERQVLRRHAPAMTQPACSPSYCSSDSGAPMTGK